MGISLGVLAWRTTAELCQSLLVGCVSFMTFENSHVAEEDYVS